MKGEGLSAKFVRTEGIGIITRMSLVSKISILMNIIKLQKAIFTYYFAIFRPFIQKSAIYFVLLQS